LLNSFIYFTYFAHPLWGRLYLFLAILAGFNLHPDNTNVKKKSVIDKPPTKPTRLFTPSRLSRRTVVVAAATNTVQQKNWLNGQN